MRVVIDCAARTRFDREFFARFAAGSGLAGQLESWLDDLLPRAGVAVAVDGPEGEAFARPDWDVERPDEPDVFAWLAAAAPEDAMVLAPARGILNPAALRDCLAEFRRGSGPVGTAEPLHPNAHPSWVMGQGQGRRVQGGLDFEQGPVMLRESPEAAGLPASERERLFSAPGCQGSQWLSVQRRACRSCVCISAESLVRGEHRKPDAWRYVAVSVDADTPVVYRFPLLCQIAWEEHETR